MNHQLPEKPSELAIDVEQWRSDIQTFAETTNRALAAIAAELSSECSGRPSKPKTTGMAGNANTGHAITGNGNAGNGNAGNGNAGNGNAGNGNAGNGNAGNGNAGNGNAGNGNAGNGIMGSGMAGSGNAGNGITGNEIETRFVASGACDANDNPGSDRLSKLKQQLAQRIAKSD